MSIREDMGWVPFTSMSAARKICKCALSWLTPTNLLMVQNLAPPVVVVFGPTVCQGKIRCHINKKTVREDGRITPVTLYPAIPLNIAPKEIDRSILYTAKGSFCIYSTEATYGTILISHDKKIY